MKITFPKLYRYDRIAEHCNVAIPFAKGAYKDIDDLQIYQDEKLVPVQKKITSRYPDGSVRYAFIRFMADLKANKKTELECVFDSKDRSDYSGVTVDRQEDGIVVKAGVEFRVKDNSSSIFDWLEDGRKKYSSNNFVGPYLSDGEGNDYGVELDKWSVVEEGPLCVILKCMGRCVGERSVTFEVNITAYADKSWIEVSHRIINTTDNPLHIASLVFAVLDEKGEGYNPVITRDEASGKGDSTGCGDMAADYVSDNMVFTTSGINSLADIEKEAVVDNVRTCAGNSNYKTTFSIGKDGTEVNRVVDAAFLMGEANEHFAEVMYGTFFADRTDAVDGICATIYQAQQNYPKAVKADKSGLYVMIVPKDVDKVVMESGMSREQKFLLHFHEPSMPVYQIDNRSLIYQMPDKPSIPPKMFKDANVMLDIFVDEDKLNYEVEIALIGKCDGHARCFGMLNWGDAPDPGYTLQGRGKGMPVWTNNEYDYPHACAQFYARTGERRFLDYMIVAASHWMDVDVCHYSKDPLRIGGQWEHTRGHCKDGIMVCSHEWVEGLLDCYHFTGNERAYETAIGIGDNILRLLETPMYQKSGESNARETGWALRTLVALYIETADEKWLGRCKWIVGHFEEWTKEYGGWLAPYTDNTAIRVPFMISVAVGSLMRYYRVFNEEAVKELIISAVDDMVDSCLMDNGLFFYKELPSLCRLGNNTLVLEALTIAYELTGDTKYLEYGKGTFWSNIHQPAPAVIGVKSIVEDAVVHKSNGTKNFAQCFTPLSVYYKAMSDNNML